jgi:cell division protein FtsI/penicillin-binding protein 2
MAPNTNIVQTVKRIRLWHGLLLLIIGIFIIRLFDMQVIHYDHYKQAALNDQLKQYQIPAQRGLIEAYDNGQIVPIVLNQKLYTVYADPTLVKNADKAAEKIQPIIGGDADQLAKLMRTKHTRYVVLAKKLGEDKSKQLLSLKIPGVGTQAVDYRTYPQGALAAQVLGFVNTDGSGEYGLEQALNPELSGTPGEVKAVTDVNGVPLAATKGNVEIAPKNGDNIVTTLDLSMQAQMEQILANEYQATKSEGLSAIIMDPNSGQIKAMANYPTFDPAHYADVTDPAVFQNAAITNAIEPGSTMKTLTTAAALDQGVITPDETFYDPAHWLVNGFNITDIEEDGGAREQSVASTLSLSLNTGATWMLMQMSQPGGTTINQKGINAWHNYLVNHFRLGQPTGIEQGYESGGIVPTDDPNEPARALKFANTAFGQGLQLTALQLGSALSSVLNGGTYYQPTLVDQTISSDGKATIHKPKVLERHVVSSQIGPELEPLLQGVISHYHDTGFSYMSFPSQYVVGGKTGTAQIANPAGGYYEDKFNGTYVGFVGGDKPQYVIVVFNIQPHVPGYAGSRGGQPVFSDLAHMLINNSFVTPKTH